MIRLSTVLNRLAHTFVNRYHYSGLTLSSAIRLPELTVADEAAEATETDVLVRYGRVARPTGVCRDGRRRFAFECRGAGRYLVEDGARIIVDPEPGADPALIRVMLLGSAMGALCMQRGLFLLHSSVVEVGGRNIAFTGHSGAGKSTMAAALHHLGHAQWCDDVCRLTSPAEGRPLFHADLPRVRLWGDALAWLGRRGTEAQRLHAGKDKFQFPIEPPAGGLRPLHRVYLLEEREGPIAVERLHGLHAIKVLSHNTYRPRYVAAMGLEEAYFAQAARASARLGVYRLCRPRALSRMEEVVRFLLAHLESGAPHPVAAPSRPRAEPMQ